MYVHVQHGYALFILACLSVSTILLMMYHIYFNDDVSCGQEPRPSSDTHRIQSLPPRLLNEDPLSSDEEEETVTDRSMSRVRQRSLRRKRFIFTNELSSKELVSILVCNI